MRAEEQEPRYRWMVPAIGGLVLVFVGCMLFMDQLGYGLPYRWLFLVLLIPASGALCDSVRIAKLLGWRSAQALSRLIAGTLFALIGILISLRLDTGLILPALITALGVATILRAVFGTS